MENLIFLQSFLGKHPNTTIKTWGNASGLSIKSAKRLMRWGIVKNFGSTRYPQWKWVGAEPNEKMANLVMSDARVYKKKRRKSSKAKRSQSSLLDVVMKFGNVKLTVNKDIVIDIKSSNDITVSRNSTRMKVTDLTMLENILSLTA